MSDSTYIASDLKLTGVFNAPGQTVVIAGRFEGEMTAGSVEITSNAVFEGLVKASEMVVAGRFNGVLETDQLTVSEQAVIAGELVTHALSVDAGADISGTVRRKPDQTRSSSS
jgi:cytoskeletal protein CcmA (bactofilin family)